MLDVRDESWRHKAVCKGEDTEYWFPPRNKDLYKKIADQAKTYCFGIDGKSPCPVRRECLWYAVSHDEQHGIWGGMSHRERNALQRKWKKNYSATITFNDFINQLDRTK